jgi:hypothetical protein
MPFLPGTKSTLPDWTSVGGVAAYMATESFYRDQAKLLFLWAAAATDPLVAARLSQRAQRYLILAEAQGHRAIRQQQQQPQPQQQQQPQSKPDGDREG